MRAANATIVAAALLLAACGQGATPNAQAPAAPAPNPTVASASPTAAPQPTAVAPAPTVAASPTAAGTPVVQTETLARGLDTPWAIDFAPDGRIFVSERPRRIRVIRDGRLVEQPWMTLQVAEVGEGGLMGLALDPQFAQNRYVYAAFTLRTANGQLQNRLVRLRDDPNAGPGGTGTLDRVILETIPGAQFHDGARVKFGPDGTLYLTMGDAQVPDLAQNRESLAGKILRMHPDGSVPPDNPFPNSLVYSTGHRNPQGLAWQPGTGHLYSTEHGPSGSPCCQDELNFIEAGRNYGWPAITGDASREGMLPPIRHSGANATWAPAGMTFVSRGPWTGALLFTALRGTALYRVTLDGADPRRVTAFEPLFQGQFGRLRDVAEAPDGTLYLLTSNQDGRGQPGPEDDRIIRLTVR